MSRGESDTPETDLSHDRNPLLKATKKKNKSPIKLGSYCCK